MPSHAERRKLPYRQDQLFALVADVESYPQFLPWCVGARLRERQGSVFWADLILGFKLVRERFTSRVELFAPEKIAISYTEGPFKRLESRWLFQPDLGRGGTWIDFYVDFELRSRMLEAVMGLLFHDAVVRMVGAFEARAAVLYGAR